MMTVTAAGPAVQAQVGEGPVWDEEHGLLWWVDIPAGLVHTSELASGHTRTLDIGEDVGAVALTTGGAVVTATAAGFGVLTGSGHEPRLSVLSPGHRMNDAKCDRAGRLWAGSVARDFTVGQGALHVLRPDWSHDVVLTGLTLPNGLGWSPDDTTFYLADSMAGALYAFAFDLDSGALGDRRLLRRFAASDGLPDGLCVDSAGSLWLAMWDGGRVLHLSADGDLLDTVEVPVSRPSSCCFGGPAGDQLFVTSAAEGLSPTAGAAGLDGGVLVVTGTGHTGSAPERFALHDHW